MTALTLISNSVVSEWFISGTLLLTAQTTVPPYPVPMTGREFLHLFPNPAQSGHLLAHEGGWDEILLVGGPLATIALLLWIANRRVAAKLAEQAKGSEDQSEVE
jgi:hypothetical protein